MKRIFPLALMATRGDRCLCSCIREAGPFAALCSCGDIPITVATPFLDFRGCTRESIRASSIVDWSEGSIRPHAGKNHEYVDPFLGELWIQHDGGPGQICAPNGAGHEWGIEHQMGYIVAAGIGKIRLFRHHVGE